MVCVGMFCVFGWKCKAEVNDDVLDFTEKEVKVMLEAGATAVGLGPHRLRVETATIALLATLMLWSDSQKMLNP